ncbi:hypothetical protein E3Q06_00632 [Wallemia mellicola]|nr:hypothetical protein E3Q06_00632 [Wallemia mellicola]
MREGTVKQPLRAKYISHQLEEGHWVSAYAPDDVIRVRGRKPYHNWGDRAPWPTCYSLQAIEIRDQMWHNTLKSYRGGQNIMRVPLNSSQSAGRPPDRPFRVLDIGCGTGTWCLEMSQIWKDSTSAEIWGMDLVPIQPNPEYFRPDYTVADRVNWLIASFLDKWPFEDQSFDFIHMRFVSDNIKVSLGIPEVQFYHVFDEAFRVLKPEGHLEIYERTYQFAAGHTPIPISNPEMAPPKEKHSYTELERLYEEPKVLTAHTINSSPLSIIASAIVLYDAKNIVQSPVIRGTFPALSFKPERTSDYHDPDYEPSIKSNVEQFMNTVTTTIESLNPYERDYRFRMILQSLSTMISESSDWLWDEYLTKVVGLSEEHGLFKGLNNVTMSRSNEENSNSGVPNGTPIQSRRNSLSTNVVLNAPPPAETNIPIAWSNKDKFDAEVKEWSSDLNRRASPDKFLELIFGWGDGREEDFCPGGRKLVGAKTWSNERKLECESADDKLGIWQMCGFRIQKS